MPNTQYAMSLPLVSANPAVSAECLSWYFLNSTLYFPCIFPSPPPRIPFARHCLLELEGALEAISSDPPCPYSNKALKSLSKFSQTPAIRSYPEINLKFAFKLYLCKIPNESPTAFFTPSFPGFRIFSLKVSNAFKGILNGGHLQAANSQSQKLSSFLISSVGTLCFP